jgi:hypothetical protein
VTQFVALPFQLVEEAGDLRRVALQVQLDGHGDGRKPLERFPHALPDEGLRALGVDLHQVEARPVGAEPIERVCRRLHRAAAVGVGPALQ